MNVAFNPLDPSYVLIHWKADASAGDILCVAYERWGAHIEVSNSLVCQLRTTMLATSRTAVMHFQCVAVQQRGFR